MRVNEAVARGMSRRLAAMPNRTPHDDDRFELTEELERSLLTTWMGVHRELWAALVHEQMTDWTLSLRTVEMEKIQETRAKIDGLQQFLNRIDRTVTALKEGK